VTDSEPLISDCASTCDTVCGKTVIKRWTEVATVSAVVKSGKVWSTRVFQMRSCEFA
jgi:hypothetical protein